MQAHDSTVLAGTPAELSAKAGKLPKVDVRTRLNERAMRGWTESSRRAARVLVLLLSDTAAGLLGIWTVLNTWDVVSAGGQRPVPDEVPMLAMVLCLMPLALRVTGAYSAGTARTDALKIMAGVGVAAVLGWVQGQLFGREDPSIPNKTAYVYAFVLVTLYAWMFRLLLDRVVALGYEAHLLQRRVLVVGTGAEARDFTARTSGRRGSDLNVVGALAPSMVSASQQQAGIAPLKNGVQFVGDIDRLEDAVLDTRAHGVIVVSNLSFATLESLIAACFQIGITIAVVPTTVRRLNGAHVEVIHSSAGALLQVRPLRLGIPQLAVKRTMDVVVSALGLIAVAPLLGLIAIAIRLEGAGPVLFRQVRLSVGGRRFEILKFRTMVVGADDMKASLQHLSEYPDSRLFKIKSDPRVTRLGRFLRRYSLDELPQLWNVLRGDMSLVGPRPCVPEEFAQYAPHHMERLFVVPGVTGPWQVNGRNAITDFEEVVRFDQEYIRNWSLTRDLLILLKTIPTLVRRGAY